MHEQRYGYFIIKEIYFDINSKRLYRLPVVEKERCILFGSMFLNETAFRLLMYLLTKAHRKNVSKEELMEKVWEDYKLSSSSQRLCQVVRTLNTKLNQLGFNGEFIKNSRGKGYIIDCEEVTAVYRKVESTEIF